MRLRRPAEPRLDPELAKQLLAEVDAPVVYPGVKPLKTTAFAQQACQHCGGLHARNCPAVQEIEYHPDGKIRRVAYWPHGEWPTEDVLWLEDIREAAEMSEEEPM